MLSFQGRYEMKTERFFFCCRLSSGVSGDNGGSRGGAQGARAPHPYFGGKKKKKKKKESQKEEKPTRQATKNQPHTSAQGPDPPLGDSVFYRQ